MFSLDAYVAVPISIYLYSLIVRIIATLLYLRSGILALPRNFRRLVLCTSPVQVPELVPGLEAAGSPFTLTYLRTHFLQDKNRLGERLTWGLVLFLWSFIMFLPAWLYRVTLKSTAWFWWPLAFLGGDLRRAQNPDLFHWKVMGGLWARSSIILSCMTLLGFVTSNFVFDGTIFEHNPLLTPLGYLFLFNWNIRPWQVCAILGSLLSVIIVLSVHDVSGEYRIAQETDNDDLRRTAQRKLGWIERLARFRLIILLIFWALIGTHAFLYENGQKCWFSLTPRLHAWAETLYGDQLPRSTCHT